ncbi:MAG: hypothetical protein VB061_00705 [Christensenella sp.]|nr:hypothetical protein [Christensenella sp.]
MPIVHCPECQKEISNVAEECPYCGYPIGKRIRKSRAKAFLGKYGLWIVLSLITLAVIIFIALYTNRDKSTISDNTKGNAIEATPSEIEAKQLYYDYFEKKYGWDNENVDSMDPDSNKYNVFLADLTHDGVDEMIVVDDTIYSGEQVELIIYTCQNNHVDMLYFERSTRLPRGTDFGLYYTDKLTYLLVCTNAMWMTGGTVSYEVFSFSDNGEKQYLISDMYTKTKDPENYDEEDPGLYDFLHREETIINKSKILFESGSGYACQSDPKEVLSIASNMQSSNLSETSVFPLSVPKRLDIAEQEKLFHQAITLLDTDRLKATMMYDFSKRFSLHWGGGSLVTNQNVLAIIVFDEQIIEFADLTKGKYPVAVDRFSMRVLLNDGTESDNSLESVIFEDVVAVCSNRDVSVGLKRNGKVVCYDSLVGESVEYESNYIGVQSWTDIVAIDAGDTQIVGLKSDGTVVAVGSDKNGQLNVGDWENIVAVSAGQGYTIGLKADGTVVTTLKKEQLTEEDDHWYARLLLDDWKQVIAISAGDGQVVGLKVDGTILYACFEDFDYIGDEISNWSDIVAVASGLGEVMALRADGTLLVAGGREFDEFNKLKLW